MHAEQLALEKANKLKPFPDNRRDVILFTNLEPCLMCVGTYLVLEDLTCEDNSCQDNKCNPTSQTAIPR